MICPHCSSMLTKKEGKKRNKDTLNNNLAVSLREMVFYTNTF